jgi:TolA-binding protein
MNMRLKIVIGLLLGLLLAGCDAFDKTATNEYQEATKRWTAGDYHNAVRMYFAVARDHPYSPHADNALYWAGVTQFLYLGESENALATLQLVLKKYPHRDMAPSAQFYIAQIYDLGYSNYDRAIVEYRKAADYNTDREVREKSLYALADNLFRTGKIAEARETWLREIDEFPRGPQAELAYFRLGTTAFSTGKLDEAELYYRKALERNKDPDLMIKIKFALADCLEARDNLGEALKLYREIEPVYANRDAIQIKIRALETRIKKKSY